MSCERHGYTNNVFCPACDIEGLENFEGKSGKLELMDSGQFYITICQDFGDEIPVDNVSYITDQGDVVKLEMSGGECFVSIWKKLRQNASHVKCKNVAAGLRYMADILDG